MASKALAAEGSRVEEAYAPSDERMMNAWDRKIANRKPDSAFPKPSVRRKAAACEDSARKKERHEDEEGHIVENSPVVQSLQLTSRNYEFFNMPQIHSVVGKSISGK